MVLESGPAAFARDRKGSVHILETMIIGLMVVGSIVYVSTLSQPPSTDDEHIPIHHDETEDILENLIALPAQNETIHFTNRLEEYVVQSLRGDNDRLEHHVHTRGPGDTHRLILQHEENETAVLGPPEPPRTIPSTGTAQYVSRLGHTLIQPAVSHFTPNTPIHLQSLPAWINRIPIPAGEHYQVDLTLEADDPLQDEPVIHTHTTQHAFRTPHRWHNPLLITFHEEPTKTKWEYKETEILGLTGYNWTVQARLQAAHPERTAPWLTSEDIIRIHIPPKWDTPLLEHPGDWQILEGSSSHVIRLKYQGQPLRGDTEGWLNFTLTRDLTEPLLHHERVTVQQEARTWSRATLVLTPSHPVHHLPITVYPSQPNPFPHNVSQSDPELRLTVVNPTPHTARLATFTVSFPDGYRVNGDVPNWDHEYDNWTGPSEYRFQDTPTIDPYGAVELVLPVEARQDDGTHVRHVMPPVIDHETPGLGSPHIGFSSHAQGPLGLYESFLSPETVGSLDGDYEVQNEAYLPHHIPPGSNTYRYTSAPDPVIEQLQQARSTMQLHTAPFHADLDEPVRAMLDTGDFLPTLREIPDIEDDRVRVNVEAGSLFSHLIDQPEVQLGFGLDLAWNAGIVGLEWIPRGTTGYDLLMAYSDGHVVLLDGQDLPDTSLWRKHVADSLREGPFLLDTPEGPRFAVITGMRGVDSGLLVFDLDGDLVRDKSLAGLVQETVRDSCVPGGGVAYLSIDSEQAEEYNAIDPVEDELRASPVRSWVGVIEDAQAVQDFHLGRVHPVGLDVGRFGPGEDCSLVVGYQLDGADGPGQVKWISLEGGGGSTLDVESGVRGVFVDRVEGGSDRLVVVTRDSGWFASDGVSKERAKEVSFDLLDKWFPGDRFIGLSWVDGVTGYAVTETGYVWETRDGGQEWERWDLAVIDTSDPRQLVDFAFGGNGDALFRRDNGDIREYHNGSLSDGWIEISRLNQVHGLVEAEEGPAVLGVWERGRRTGSYVWDFTDSWPDVSSPVHEVSCLCLEGASGHSQGIVAWNETHVLANTTHYPEWNGTVRAEEYAVDPDGHTISLQSEGGQWSLVKEREDQHEEIQLAKEVRDRLNADLKAGRNPTGAYLHYQDDNHPGMLTFVEGGFRHRSAPPNFVGLSGGPGGPWWVLEHGLRPVTQVDRYEFTVRSDEFTQGQELSLRLVSPAGGQEVRWRVQGNSLWKDLGQSTATSWQEPFVLEVSTSKNPDWVLQDPELTLEIVPETGDPADLKFGMPECNSCLVSGAPVQYFEGGWGWAPKEGLLPSDSGFETETQPVVVRQEGRSYLVGGSDLTGHWSHDTGIGLPWRDLGVEPESGSETRMVFHTVRTPSGEEILLGEHGEFGTNRDGTALPGAHLGPGAEGSSVLYQLDPVLGEITCRDTLERYGGINVEMGRHHPVAELFVLGSKWGELTGRDPECGVGWDRAGLEVGSRLNVEVPPPGRGWQRGPVILRVEVQVGLEGQDPVSLYFLDSAYRTPGKTLAPEVVIYRAHLHYWFWEDGPEDPKRPGLRVEP